MSFAYLIRHAQASAHAEDYDQLSSLGYEQSKLLHQHLLSQPRPIDHVWVGPRKRHRQTYETVRQSTWPEAEHKSWLDEFPAHEIMDKGIETLRGTEWQPDIDLIEASVGTGGESYLRILQYLCDLWIEDALFLEDVETCSSYKARIQAGLQELQHILDRGESVIIFSSAGLICSTLGVAMQADDKLSLRNAWSIYNASIQILRSFQQQYMMVGFNWIHHIPSNKRTFV